MASTMLNKSWLALAIAALAIVAFVGIPLRCEPSLLSQKAPDFRLPTIEGANITLSELAGTPVVLYFWTTWCAPCRKGLPYYEALAKEGEGKLKVIAINVGEGASAVRTFFGTRQPAMIVALDENQNVSRTYNPQGWIPVTIFIDREGIVRYIKTGAFASERELRDKLKEVLGITVPQTS